MTVLGEKVVGEERALLEEKDPQYLAYLDSYYEQEKRDREIDGITPIPFNFRSIADDIIGMGGPFGLYVYMLSECHHQGMVYTEEAPGINLSACDSKGYIIFAQNQQEVAEALDVSRPTIVRYFKILKELGWIKLIGREKAKHYSWVNLYALGEWKRRNIVYDRQSFSHSLYYIQWPKDIPNHFFEDD